MTKKKATKKASAAPKLVFIQGGSPWVGGVPSKVPLFTTKAPK